MRKTGTVPSQGLCDGDRRAASPTQPLRAPVPSVGLSPALLATRSWWDCPLFSAGFGVIAARRPTIYNRRSRMPQRVARANFCLSSSPDAGEDASRRVRRPGHRPERSLIRARTSSPGTALTRPERSSASRASATSAQALSISGSGTFRVRRRESTTATRSSTGSCFASSWMMSFARRTSNLHRVVLGRGL